MSDDSKKHGIFPTKGAIFNDSLDGLTRLIIILLSLSDCVVCQKIISLYWIEKLGKRKKKRRKNEKNGGRIVWGKNAKNGRLAGENR